MGIYYPLAHPHSGLADGTTAAQVDTTETSYSEAENSFWNKVEAIQEAGEQARETGQAVNFTETFSEDEINAALAGLLDDYSDQRIQINDAKIILGDESIRGIASCTILGKELSISGIPDIWLENHKPMVRIKSLDIEEAPGFIDRLATRMINRSIDAEYDRVLQKYDNYEISSIIIKSQQITVAGVAR